MYAIVEMGGRQWRVEPGTRVVINRIAQAVGSHHTVERVLLASDGKTLQVGRPYCPGAKVLCEVLEHARGPKTITYKFRRRENYRKTRGHRQELTKLLVKDIQFGDGAPASAVRPAKTADKTPPASVSAKGGPGKTAKPKRQKPQKSDR